MNENTHQQTQHTKQKYRTKPKQPNHEGNIINITKMMLSKYILLVYSLYEQNDDKITCFYKRLLKTAAQNRTGGNCCMWF